MKAAVNIANKGKGGRLVFGELMDFSRHCGRQGSEKGGQTPNSAQQNGYDWGGERCGIRVSPLFSPKGREADYQSAAGCHPAPHKP
jgi:hypothetical protein